MCAFFFAHFSETNISGPVGRAAHEANAGGVTDAHIDCRAIHHGDDARAPGRRLCGARASGSVCICVCVYVRIVCVRCGVCVCGVVMLMSVCCLIYCDAGRPFDDDDDDGIR